MSKLKSKHKLWQSLINTNLTPDEFVNLTVLGKIREQSLRELVSNILRQEITTFADLIKNVVNDAALHNSLDASTASKKRSVGRPRLYNTRLFLQEYRDKTLPTSMEQIIDEKLKE